MRLKFFEELLLLLLLFSCFGLLKQMESHILSHSKKEEFKEQINLTN